MGQSYKVRSRGTKLRRAKLLAVHHVWQPDKGASVELDIGRLVISRDVA
jgi:hypothetical protein